MLFHIRPVGTEVRRPEGITLRKTSSDRHPDARSAQETEGAKVTIGGQARRLATPLSESETRNQSGSNGQPEGTPEAGRASVSGRSSEEAFRQAAAAAANSSAGRSAAEPPPSSLSVANNALRALRTNQQTDRASVGEPSVVEKEEVKGAVEDAPIYFTTDELNRVPYEALQRAAATADLPEAGPFVRDPVFGGEEEPEVALDAGRVPLGSQARRVFEDPERALLGNTAGPAAESPQSRVSFDVLQRAVTQAASQSGSVLEATLFAAPENGGKPFGREVPFEPTEDGPALDSTQPGGGAAAYSRANVGRADTAKSELDGLSRDFAAMPFGAEQIARANPRSNVAGAYLAP